MSAVRLIGGMFIVSCATIAISLMTPWIYVIAFVLLAVAYLIDVMAHRAAQIVLREEGKET